MRIAIVDDLQEALEDLAGKLPEEYSVDRFNDIEVFMQEQRKCRYDLVFLDVELGKEKDGIDFAGEVKKSMVVFVTAFTMKYVEKIMNGRVAPIGFLKKPVDREQLEKVLEKAEKKLKGDGRRVTFFCNGRAVVLPVKQLMYLEGQMHKTRIHTADGTVYDYNDRLEAAKNLCPDTFIQCHKSFLVNPLFIKEFGKDGILLQDGMCIPVSRAKAKQSHEKFMKYLGEM